MKKVCFLILLNFLSFGFLFAQDSLRINAEFLPYLDSKKAPFYHGLASGDPTQTSLVIWTKVTLPVSVLKTSVYWELSIDSSFYKILKKGTRLTDESTDFTVKVEVDKLESGREYYYRFRYDSIYSIVGKTKTLTDGKKPIKLAFASCSNFEYGYFSNYRFIAEDKQIDAVIHLGDYIYEYGNGEYGDTSLGRKNIPPHEIISLKDYRTRYSLYRLDKDLQKLHQYKPVITTWDDHEIANNAYSKGAENHQAKDGDWETRKSSAIQAYYEWLPVNNTPNNPLYRSFSFGKLLNLIILDTRMAERSLQVDSVGAENLLDTNRTILGKKQFDWLSQNLQKHHTWNIIGNQVPFGPMYGASLVKKESYMDGWDGYPFERHKFIEFLNRLQLKNIVIVTGDYHRSFAIESDEKGTLDTADNVAVEFIVSSINSANDDEYYGDEKAKERRQLYLKNNPPIKYVNNTDHGYLVLTAYENKIEASYIYSSTVKTPHGKPFLEKTFIVEPGKPRLIEK